MAWSYGFILFCFFPSVGVRLVSLPHPTQLPGVFQLLTPKHLLALDASASQSLLCHCWSLRVIVFLVLS